MPEIVFDEEYRDGQMVKRVQRTVSDAEIERREDGDRLRQAQATLRQWAIDAEAVGSAGGTPTAAQLRALFTRFGMLCRLQVRIIRKLGEDDGA